MTTPIRVRECPEPSCPLLIEAIPNGWRHIIPEPKLGSAAAPRSTRPARSSTDYQRGYQSGYHAARRTSGSPRGAANPEQTLDVDRLWHACSSLGIDLVRLDQDDIRIWHTTGNEASEIAAEYARLGEPE